MAGIYRTVTFLPLTLCAGYWQVSASVYVGSFPCLTTPERPVFTRLTAVFATMLAAGLSLPPATLAAQQAPPVGTANPPMVVTAEWVAEQRNNPDVVVLHVEHGDYAEGHVPGARALPYRQLVESRDELSSELPTPADLRELFASLGISDRSHVVVYAHEAPMATRALLSLAAIGHTRHSFLDGGLAAWKAHGLSLSTATPTWERGQLRKGTTRDVVVTADWIRDRQARGGVALIDTRTDGEYNGTGNRSGMPSAGHLAGARQLEWQELFTDGMVTLKPEAQLRALFADRVQEGDVVVTYCWVGYRASATWFLARTLGYDARLYDGSYQDWMQRELPTVSGATPHGPGGGH